VWHNNIIISSGYKFTKINQYPKTILHFIIPNAKKVWRIKSPYLQA